MTLLNQPLLFEMMRSFVTMARTLNLSHAVEDLGSTRQTVRRHIDTLETAMGVTLFVVEDRKYQLTEAGSDMLPSAETILAQGRLWLQGQLSETDGMMRLSYEDDSGLYFFIQKQKISEVWGSGSKLMPAAIKAWSESHGNLEDPAMDAVRPYVLVYRETPSGWICVEVGSDSFFSNWWGWAEARSSVGRPLDQFPGGLEVAAIMKLPFLEVQSTDGMRLDQVATITPRGENRTPTPVVFNRLLLGSRMPDGTFAMVVVVDKPKALTISNLDPSYLEDMPNDIAVDFTPS